MAKVISVSADSALKGALKTGDEVLGFNGREFSDILDYIYADGEEEGTLTVRDKKGTRILSYKKSAGETLGLEFDPSTELVPRVCKNNCIFCFVKQLPKNLRKTLYVRDDDYRFSLISGCYITCTNLDEEDIGRIIAYGMSPLYVSVHATDENIRGKLLGVGESREILPILEKFIGADIKIHAQIVLLPGINDGEILKKSLKDLQKIGVSTVAVVPVGLTKYRENLPNVFPVGKSDAEKALASVEEFYSEHPKFCYCSDEMYFLAGKDTPPADYYGNYEQIENGVGLAAKFFEDLKNGLKTASYRGLLKRTVGVFTGISGESVVKKAKRTIENRFPLVKINIYPVKNEFFGETVTVTGLVTASDILRCYGGRKFKEKFFLIPSVMLKEFGDVFLDDVNVDTLSRKLGKKVKVVDNTGAGFLKGVLNGV